MPGFINILCTNFPSCNDKGGSKGGREGKGRDGAGRERNGREGKGSEAKGREGKGTEGKGGREGSSSSERSNHRTNIDLRHLW